MLAEAQLTSAVAASSTPITLSIEWLLGILIAAIGGSYIFTWKTFKLWREGNAKLWETVTRIETNHLTKIEARLNKLEDKE